MGLVALVSILPVPTRRWMPAALPLPALGLYIAYEAAMPHFWDVRLDLLLILPLLTITFIASGVRFFLLRRAKKLDT